MPHSQNKEADRRILKRYLAQYYRARERQRILKERLASLQTELNHPAIRTPATDAVPVRTGPGTGAASLTLRIAEIEDRIQRQAEVEARVILEVMDALEFLPPDSTEKYIMELRHIDCMSWVQIQRTVHLSRSPCYDRYNKGLDALLTFDAVRQRLADYAERNGH